MLRDAQPGRVIVDTIAARNVATVPHDATVRDAARVMGERGVGGLVVTIHGRAAGMFTERDLARRVVAKGLDPAATRVGDVMTAPLVTVEPTATVEEAAETMRRLRVKRLVVVLDGDVRGVVTVTDLAHALPELAPRFVETWVKRRWED